MKRLFFILIVLISACTKDEISSELMLNVDVEQAIPDSKSIVTGTTLPNNSTIGLYIFYAEDVDPHVQLKPYGEKYMNIRSVYSNGSWEYRFDKTSSTNNFKNIYLIDPRTDDSRLGFTIYSYAPWVTGAEDITEIPFVLGGSSKAVTDLMWASQNETSANARILPNGDPKTVNLSFKHALAMLRFGFKCRYENTQMKASSITLRKKTMNTDGTPASAVTPLYASGNFNGINGTFSSLQESGAMGLTVSYTDDNIIFNNSGYTYLPVLIIPSDYSDGYEDGDYEVVFNFNDHQLDFVYSISAPSGSEMDLEFEAGHTYTFNFIFDNQIRFENILISNQWQSQQRDIEF